MTNLIQTQITISLEKKYKSISDKRFMKKVKVNNQEALKINDKKVTEFIQQEYQVNNDDLFLVEIDEKTNLISILLFFQYNKKEKSNDIYLVYPHYIFNKKQNIQVEFEINKEEYNKVEYLEYFIKKIFLEKNYSISHSLNKQGLTIDQVKIKLYQSHNSKNNAQNINIKIEEFLQDYFTNNNVKSDAYKRLEESNSIIHYDQR